MMFQNVVFDPKVSSNELFILLCANICALCKQLCKPFVQTPTLDTVWLDPILSGSSAKKFYIPEKSEEFEKKFNKEKFTASSSILFKKNFTKSCRAHRSLKNVNNLELFLLSPLFFSTKNFYIPHKYDSKKLKRFESFSNLFM